MVITKIGNGAESGAGKTAAPLCQEGTVLLGPVVGPSRTGEPEQVRAGRSVLRSGAVSPAS